MSRVEFEVIYITALSGGIVDNESCGIDNKSLENYFLEQDEIQDFKIKAPDHYPSIRIKGKIEKSKLPKYLNSLEKEVKSSFESGLKRAGYLIQKNLEVSKLKFKNFK